MFLYNTGARPKRSPTCESIISIWASTPSSASIAKETSGGPVRSGDRPWTRLVAPISEVAGRAQHWVFSARGLPLTRFGTT